MNYIFAFKSRTCAMNFYELLRQNGISSSVINTPPAAQIGCGLSVKIADYNLGAARKIYSSQSYQSLGIFKITYSRGRYYVDRV